MLRNSEEKIPRKHFNQRFFSSFLLRLYSCARSPERKTKNHFRCDFHCEIENNLTRASVFIWESESSGFYERSEKERKFNERVL